ncbi:hypothetical protein Pcinc_004084 [Petrolisthes cinctipes]|uniref:Uncharacterized protein n=1 Tax=Petrolisthes cinctipes TaxID=88211 RepID=A0AAE1L1Y8_PETCI|nr:hypothetical protein Pcinc_004084 [Petrolisthes cinctipes]
MGCVYGARGGREKMEKIGVNRGLATGIGYERSGVVRVTLVEENECEGGKMEVGKAQEMGATGQESSAAGKVVEAWCGWHSIDDLHTWA